VSYLTSFLLAKLNDLDTPVQRFYENLYLYGSLPYLLLVSLLYVPRFQYRPIFRMLLVILAYVPLLVEVTLHTEFHGGLLWWAVFVAGYGALLLIDPLQEGRYQIALIASALLLGCLAAVLHHKLAYLPPNPMGFGALRYSLLLGAMVLAAYWGLLQQRDLLREAREQAQAQQALREAAEAQKAHLEEALRELEALQAAEKARQEEEAFFLVYEGLMQRSYAESIPTFLRRLLEQLGKDLPALGAVVYLKEGTHWVVRAQYALPHAEGKKASTGVLALAARERRPYLIHPAPKGCSSIPGALYTFPPTAILYLPFWSEASQETQAIAELFLHALPGPSELERMERLLHRIGTYLWARQETQALL